MLIVVYRSSEVERNMSMMQVVIRINECNLNAKVDSNNKIIKSDDVEIRFISRPLSRLIGLRPAYYNTDWWEANEYFTSTGAKEIDLSQIGNIILEHNSDKVKNS